MGKLTNNQKFTWRPWPSNFGKNQEEDNNFGNFGKIQEEEDHGFEGTAKDKKMTFGTLEKTMKKKTMTSRFWPGRRRP